MLGPRHRAALVAAALIPVILVACSGEFMRPPVLEIERPRATRMGLIDFFAQAHEDRDINAYSECLHPDYTFWFWQDEVFPDPWPSLWIDKTDDVRVTKNMFESENVTSIRAVFTNLTTGADSGSWHAEAVPDGEGSTHTVFWAEFLVDMHVGVCTGEEDFEHWVNGKATIYVCADGDDEQLWTIWKILDRTNENKNSERTTWTVLKMLYR